MYLGNEFGTKSVGQNLKFRNIAMKNSHSQQLLLSLSYSNLSFPKEFHFKAYYEQIALSILLRKPPYIPES